MQKVEEASGVTFSSHDLRRTFASIVNQLADTMSYYTVKRLLNHKVADVTAGYVQHNPEKLREAMEAVAGFIMKNVGLLIRKKLPTQIQASLTVSDAKQIFIRHSF